MYMLLESVACMALVSAAMAALFAASLMYIILKQSVTVLSQAPYRAVHHTGRLLARSAVLVRRQGSQLLEDWGSLLAVRTSTAVTRAGLRPSDRPLTALHRST
jgi:hypothetical protein